jgi:cytosine/adenosine deaminase-related metal-dependent hydrolase
MLNRLSVGTRLYRFLLAARHRLSVQMHYQEASGAVESDHAKGPAIREAGGVGPARAFAHCIRPDAAMVKEAAAVMIWNPLSNGAGSAPVCPTSRPTSPPG